MSDTRAWYGDQADMFETPTAYFGAAYARSERAASAKPQIYGATKQVAALRAFRRYHKDARLVMNDGRWMTRGQARVLAIVDREADKGQTTVRAIAQESRLAPSSVSRFLLKLQAWGRFGVEVRRGKYGGITILRLVGIGLSEFVKRARAKLWKAAQRVFNVASTHTLDGTEPKDVSTYYGRNIKPPVRTDWLIEEVLDALGEL